MDELSYTHTYIHIHVYTSTRGTHNYECVRSRWNGFLPFREAFYVSHMCSVIFFSRCFCNIFFHPLVTRSPSLPNAPNSASLRRLSKSVPLAQDSIMRGLHHNYHLSCSHRNSSGPSLGGGPSQGPGRTGRTTATWRLSLCHYFCNCGPLAVGQVGSERVSERGSDLVTGFFLHHEAVPAQRLMGERGGGRGRFITVLRLRDRVGRWPNAGGLPFWRWRNYTA